MDSGLFAGMMKIIEIRETTTKDLHDVQRLWADGDVMKFVGFPNGLIQKEL